MAQPLELLKAVFSQDHFTVSAVSLAVLADYTSAFGDEEIRIRSFIFFSSRFYRLPPLLTP